jgi:hypothetical protein
MGYEDIMGFQGGLGNGWGGFAGQMDIIGNGGAYQCTPMGPMGPPGPPPMPGPMPGPVPPVPPAVAGALGWGGFAAGPFGGFAQGGFPVGPGGFPGGPGFDPGFGPGFPGAALGPWGGGWGPGYGCLGPWQNPILTQRVEEPAVLLRPRCPTRFRTQWLGFERTCIGACETVVIECSVNVLTKIIRLVFPSDVAFQLLIHQIEIGNECLVQCGPIPAAMFLEDATDAEEINTETIQPGTSVRITVQNVSKSDVCLSIGAKVRVAF